ncbi:MAG: MarR family transcriptional regulator [Kutzneria sp.]|nr:MarR family transcriptional regulator [Kutzneria sp.]
MREHPLDAIDVGILVLAEETDGELRPSQAAERLDAPAPSITRHIRNLQRAGHLSIEPDVGDRRGYRIAVTDVGRAMLHNFRQDLVARFAPALEGWTPEQVRVLADGLGRLNKSMDAALENRKRQTQAASWWRTQPRNAAGDQRGDLR